MNVKLIIAYDGTHFLGWQRSIDGPTIESTLHPILEQIYQEPIALQAASRTDAGVHAQGQVVNYRSHKEKDLERLKISLNQMLPKAIRICAIQQVDETFHPTLDALGKEYHYLLSTSEIHPPFDRHFSWHYPFELNIANMKEAALHFIGTHDFAAFCNACIPRPKDTIRTVTRIDLIPEKGKLRFEIEGTHFLYKMVRNIVGTLVYVGSGKLSLGEAKSLISSRDRTRGGITAPAQGLILKKVVYP